MAQLPKSRRATRVSTPPTYPCGGRRRVPCGAAQRATTSVDQLNCWPRPTVIDMCLSVDGFT
eukprot:scaffold64926_cov60-Phaeocystis_antarctica.AAC.4